MIASVPLLKKVSLSEYTTYGIGGETQFFFSARTEEQLIEVLKWAKREGFPYFILGAGSNVLISDQGFPGLVVKLTGEFEQVEIDEGRRMVIAGGGAKVSSLGHQLIEKGWAGFEFMAVLPGTVGGAVKMNAGTKEGEIKDFLTKVQILHPPFFKKKVVKKEELKLSYRTSELKASEIILSAQFKLVRREKVSFLKERVKKMLAQRRRQHPKEGKNCGSVFKNPLGPYSAGWYIEQAGLKGKKIGQAQVSPKHANWIVNLGGARAKEVKTLINYLQKKVEERFGVKLEREVIYIPEDILPDFSLNKLS
jgi:UDP-N-acetylmuramate dehydrogenase